MEEEHQTWYFFTSALFVMIFLEKITLFRRRNNYKDSERPEILSRRVKISEHKKTSKCSSEKVIDYRNEVRNANFHNDHSYSKSTGINVDGVLPESENAFVDLSRPESAGEKTEQENIANLRLRWEERVNEQEMTLQNGFLWHLLVVLVLLGLGRLSRAWNQTGIKWANRPDVIYLCHRCRERLCLQDCYWESPVTMDTK